MGSGCTQQWVEEAAAGSTSACSSAPLPPAQRNYFKCNLEPLLKKKSSSLCLNYRNLRQPIIHYRKHKRLMQFSGRPKGAKPAGPGNRLQISARETAKKSKRIGRGPGLQLLLVLHRPWEPRSAAGAPQPAGTRPYLGMFSSPFSQPCLLSCCRGGERGCRLKPK